MKQIRIEYSDFLVCYHWKSGEFPLRFFKANRHIMNFIYNHIPDLLRSQQTS